MRYFVVEDGRFTVEPFVVAEFASLELAETFGSGSKYVSEDAIDPMLLGKWRAKDDATCQAYEASLSEWNEIEDAAEAVYAGLSEEERHELLLKDLRGFGWSEEKIQRFLSA